MLFIFFLPFIKDYLFQGDSLSHLESCIWCIVAGRLEPALSLSSRTDERLWCYANAAVECRIDARLAEERGLEKESGNLLSGNDLMVDSIFDEIITVRFLTFSKLLTVKLVFCHK